MAYRTAAHHVTEFSPFFLMFGRRPRIPFEILLTPPAKLHEEDWKAYNVEQTSHLRKAYDMVKERDRVQRLKADLLYKFKYKESDYELARSFCCALQRKSRIIVASSCLDGLVLIVLSKSNLIWFTRWRSIFGPSLVNVCMFNE